MTTPASTVALVNTLRTADDGWPAHPCRLVDDEGFCVLGAAGRAGRVVNVSLSGFGWRSSEGRFTSHRRLLARQRRHELRVEMKKCCRALSRRVRLTPVWGGVVPRGE